MRMSFGKLLVLGIGVCGLQMVAWGLDLLPYEGQPEVKDAVQALEEPARYDEPGETVRIVSYNIQDFWEGTEEGRRSWAKADRQAQLAGAILDEINADIAILQEMHNAPMVAFLNERLDEPYAIGYATQFGSTVDRSSRLNLGVLSRFPVKHVKELDLTVVEGAGRPSRGALRFEVDLDEEVSLLIYNVHLKANWGDQQRNISQRLNALTLVIEDWQTWQADRDADRTWEVIIAGDFNIDPGTDQFDGDPSLGPLDDFIDLWAGRPLEERITVPTRYGDPNLEFPPVAFDRFYVSPGFEQGPWIAGQPYVLSKGVHIDDSKAIPGEDDTTASDHYPVYIDLYRSIH